MNSKRKSGVRNEAYSLAADNGGHYNPDRQHSIFYDGSDLMLNLLFKDEDRAHKFVNDMVNYLKRTYIHTVHPRSYARVQPDFEVQRVFKEDYEPTEYADSATRSTIVTELPVRLSTSVTDEQYLMMIERRDHKDFAGIRPYRCHLIGQAVDKAWAENESNILIMSWPMHMRFDGLNSQDKNVPLIAIRFNSVGEGRHTVHGFERQQARLVVECRDKDTFDAVCERLKHPYTPHPDALEVETFVYPDDMEDFIYCCTYKYEETVAVWELQKPGDLVDEETASRLRTEASKAARAAMQTRLAAKNKKAKANG